MKSFRRKLVFFGLCLCFIVVTPILILYSQGYRFDFKEKKIVQVGGLFLKIKPVGVSVYLNHKLIKNTNFIFDSVYLGNLLPGEYFIEIKKEGYNPWKKKLRVFSKQVTEAKNILLFKNLPDILPTEVKNIQKVLYQNEETLVLLQKDETSSGIVVFNKLKRSKILFVSEKFFSSKLNFSQIVKVYPLNNNKIFLIVTPKNKVFLLNFIQNKYQLKPLDFGGRIIKITKALNNQNKVFFLVEKAKTQKLIEFQADSLTTTPLSFQFSENLKIIDFAILPNQDIVWIANNGFVFKGKIQNSALKIEEVLNLKPLLGLKNPRLIIKNNLSVVFVLDQGKLFYFDPKTHNFSLIFENVKNLTISPTKKVAVIFTPHQLWLFYLKNEYNQPQRKAKEKILLEGFEEKIENVVWLDNYHLIIDLENKIIIMETDNRSRINKIELNTGKAQIFSSPRKNRVFLLKEGSLKELELI